MFDDGLRTVRAAFGLQGYFTQTFCAFLGGWIGGWPLMRARDEHIHRFNDKEEDRSGNQHKRYESIDEVAVHELTAIECK